MKDILIKNVKIVNEGKISHGDLLISKGRIEKIASEIEHSNYNNATIFEGKNRYLIPGMIDDQVHFREPGFAHKGTIADESAAAVAGGITSFMEMPNVNPLTITHETLADKFNLAKNKSLANYSFYLGASNDNIEVIKSLHPHDACGVKVFMGASTGNMLVDNQQTLEQIFKYSPILVATHCEDTPTIIKNEQLFRERYHDDVPVTAHPLIRSHEACYLSSSLAVELAKKHGTQLHILHLTTAKELELFNSQPLSQKSITAEVCVHHLYFNETDYETKGNLIKCNPAIKSQSDQQALLSALRDKKIDIIATDHAPHTMEEKMQSYLKAPSGLPLVQHALPALFELIQQKKLDIFTVVEGTSHRVAERFQLKERGYIREGYHADLTLVDNQKPLMVINEAALSKCGWSPFAGEKLAASIAATWVNGILKWDGRNIVNNIHGEKLDFTRD